MATARASSASSSRTCTARNAGQIGLRSGCAARLRKRVGAAARVDVRRDDRSGRWSYRTEPPLAAASPLSGRVRTPMPRGRLCRFGTIPAVSGPRLPDVRRASAPVPLRVSRPRRSSLLLLGKAVRWPSLLPLSPERYRFSGAVVASALPGQAICWRPARRTPSKRGRGSARGGLSLRELAVVEGVVQAAAGQQLGVSALLYDVAGVHDDDRVRVTDRGQAVRDDEAGPAVP